jgi:hypothetical protein
MLEGNEIAKFLYALAKIDYLTQAKEWSVGYFVHNSTVNQHLHVCVHK